MIFELSEAEDKWWGDIIRKYRGEIVHKSKEYVERAISETGVTPEQARNDINKSLYNVREHCWGNYVQDEATLHREVLSFLLDSREQPRDILSNIVEEKNIVYSSIDKASLQELLPGIVGEFSGKIMPYLYQLSKSTTQSRRSRAGYEFELIVERFLDFHDYTYEDKASINNAFFKDNNLKKLVDIIVPGADYYLQNRSQCAVLTMKTTVRERWGEVVEELTRTNMPHAYLLTLDEDLTEGIMDNLKSYNITVVTYDWIVQDGLQQFDNIMGFEDFFEREIPHHLKYWDLL